MRKIFVYGTLLTGQGNHRWLLSENHHKLLGEATTTGDFKMVSLGGFPGLIPVDDNEMTIYGEVYEVDDTAYKSVEMLEGYPGFYDKLTVETNFGEAEVYILDESYLNNHEEIESGSWIKYLKENGRI